MKTFDITVIKTGFATIEAKSKEDAVRIAKELSSDDFEWSDDIEIVEE